MIGKDREVSANRVGVSFNGDDNVLNLIVVMGAQLNEYTKSLWIIHFERVNCKAYKLCLNKAVIKIIRAVPKMENDTSPEIMLSKGKWPSVGNITVKDGFN